MTNREFTPVEDRQLMADLSAKVGYTGLRSWFFSLDDCIRISSQRVVTNTQAELPSYTITGRGDSMCNFFSAAFEQTDDPGTAVTIIGRRVVVSTRPTLEKVDVDLFDGNELMWKKLSAVATSLVPRGFVLNEPMPRSNRNQYEPVIIRVASDSILDPAAAENALRNVADFIDSTSASSV